MDEIEFTLVECARLCKDAAKRAETAVENIERTDRSLAIALRLLLDDAATLGGRFDIIATAWQGHES